MHDLLLQIFISILNKGLYPDQWHNKIILSIPKPNKHKFNIINYRSILFINTLVKTTKKWSINDLFGTQREIQSNN